MARGKGTGRGSRRVTTYRVTARSSEPSPNRTPVLVVSGAVVIVGAVLLAVLLSGSLPGIIGSAIPGGGTPPPSRPAALPAGTYRSQAFQPQLTFTIPAGWRVGTDSADYLELLPVDSDQEGIYLFRDPNAASQDAACPLEPEPSVSTLSTDLSTWIRGRPGFVTSNPRLAQVGGLRGIELDVGIVDSWTPSCPFANGAPTVPLFVNKASGLRWVVAGSERLRLSLLDVPGGGTVVVDVDAFDGALWADFLNRATPIVQGFRFAALVPGATTPGGTSPGATNVSATPVPS
jgi:hypothetical protein